MERAEEIIAEVYRQIVRAREQGIKPGKVTMPPSLWKKVSRYRESLGILDGPNPDYLSENGLFGLEIWYGNNPDIRVE